MDVRLARLLHVTWGLPQTIVGAATFVVMGRRRKRYAYRSALVIEWRLDRGLSLGPFIFVPDNCPHNLVVHEYGHTVQALILGPLYLPAVVVPSLVWAGTPRLERRRLQRHVSYYSFYTERWANQLAWRVTGEFPVGWHPRR